MNTAPPSTASQATAPSAALSQPVLPASPAHMLRASLWLTLIVVGVLPVYGGVGHALFGVPGLLTAGLAAAVCWLGAVLALLCTTTVQQQVPVAGLLLGMVFRMGLPLVAGFALHQLFPALAEAGMIGFVLAYYLLTLSVETLLALRVMNSNKPATKAS